MSIPILTALLPLATILIATIARFAIKIFMIVFEWSTDIFFGKISTDKSWKLTALSALSMVWIITALCIPFPKMAEFTLVFLPKTLRTNKIIVYLLNGAGTFFIPIIVGVICVFWHMEFSKDIITFKNIKSLQYKQVLLGFYYTFFLGISFITMFIFSPLIKFINFIKRRKMIHAIAVINIARVETVLLKLKRALLSEKIKLQLKNHTLIYKIPFTLIGFLSESLFKDIIIKNRKFLYNKDLQIYIHQSDIMIVGKDELVKKTRAIISEILMFDVTYLTWNSETQKLEDEILNIYNDFISSEGNAIKQCLIKIEKVKNRCSELVVDFEDLRTVMQQALVLENMLLKKVSYKEISSKKDK